MPFEQAELFQIGEVPPGLAFTHLGNSRVVAHFERLSVFQARVWRGDNTPDRRAVETGAGFLCLKPYCIYVKGIATLC